MGSPMVSICTSLLNASFEIGANIQRRVNGLAFKQSGAALCAGYSHWISNRLRELCFFYSCFYIPV
jgi:hypothetical protein